ncbi:MAG: magnesium/cobalt efflux protein [Sutterella sp. 54_7]|nr:MAG: magnesium/cobalt efflux protein [Sutterella sp. 54_7]
MSSEPHLEKNKSFLDRLTSAFRSDEDAGDAKQDLIGALSEARADGLIGSDTFSMMQGALEVSSLRAYDLMVPRAQVDAVDLEKPTDEMIRTVIASGHAKDLLQLLLDPSRNVKSLLRPARFVPESQPLNVLLRDFKETRNHLALVIDEFGSISGLITIEDVLEQIVGDISDEFDHDDSSTNIVAEDNHWRVRAVTPIEQFNTFFGADLVDEYCETIGGLITDRCEHVPQIGEEIVEKGYRFRIQRADARQVQLLTVERA